MHAKTRNKDNAAIVDTFRISLLVVLHWNLCCCCCRCRLLRLSIFASCAFIFVITVIFDLLLFTLLLLLAATALNSLNLLYFHNFYFGTRTK